MISSPNLTLTMHFNRLCVFALIWSAVTSCTTSQYKPDSESGALLYDPNPSPTERAIWTGSKDSEGFASGFGRLKWLQHGRQVSEYEGTKVRGKWTSYRKLDRSEWGGGAPENAAQSTTADPTADLVAGLLNGFGRSVQRTYGEGRWLTGTVDNMKKTFDGMGSSSDSSGNSGASDASQFRQRHAGGYTDFTVTYDGMAPEHVFSESNYLVLRSSSGDRFSVRYSGELQSGSSGSKSSLEGTTINVRFSGSGEPESLKNTSNGKVAPVRSWELK